MTDQQIEDCLFELLKTKYNHLSRYEFISACTRDINHLVRYHKLDTLISLGLCLRVCAHVGIKPT